MSDSVTFPEEHHIESKHFGKHKWRGKLFSVESRFGRAAGNPESTDDDIANFLRTAGSRPEAGPRSAPLAPRIDVAVGLKPPSAASLDQDDRLVDAYRRPKPRQNKGLRVRFETAPPAVIGIGGDEAELPSRDVSRSFAKSMRSERSPSQERLHYTTNNQHPEAYGPSRDPGNEISSGVLSHLRRSCGVDDVIVEEKSRHAGHDREAVQSALKEFPELSPPPRGEQQGLDLSFPKKDVSNVSFRPLANEKAYHDQSYDGSRADKRTHERRRHVDISLPEASSVNSLIPKESRGPAYAFHEASSSSYYTPPVTRDLPKLPNSALQSIRQNSQGVSYSPKQKSLSLRSVVKSLGEDSLEEFDTRVRRFNDLFQLNASAHIDMMAVPFERWVRTSAWWFLMGRGGLESAVRAKFSAVAPGDAANDGNLAPMLKQAYLNLAKAWWILKHITPKHPAIRRFGNSNMASMVAVIRSLGNEALAELVEVHLAITSHLRALTMSMTRNGRLPPDDLQMQRLESQIFLETPTIPPGLAALMVNSVLESTIKNKSYVVDPFFPILLGDTPRHFSFCNIFVDVVLDCCDDVKSRVRIPCVLSILRERTDWTVKAAIASQDGQVNLVIQSDEHGGLHWHDVQWKIPLHTMQLDIAGACLQIKLSEKDFKTIWGICDYTQQVRKEYSARSGEQIAFERELPLIQCPDCPSFPAEPVKDCKLRLFERKSIAADDSGQQGAHEGYRLMVITPPGTKTLSKINCRFGTDSPILFGTHRKKGGNTLLVRASSLKISLTFKEASDVEFFSSTLSGASIAEDDHCSAPLKFQNFTISSTATVQDFVDANRCISDLRWHKLRIVSRQPPSHGHDSQLKARSETLRILGDCDSGTFTDRIGAGPGELQVNLSVMDFKEIKLLQAAKQNMTWSLIDGVLEEADLSSLSHMLHSLDKSPYVRAYHFDSSSEAHNFQAILTGFHVLYDGLAKSFSISRPRTVVPLHKHWEASTPRLQIVKQDKTVQLVAFFKDFSHGACMNFVLKVTDCFERFSRSGVFFLRIVDAKFALPKGESDPARDFVCLDVPDWPSEHDDIVIGFDTEQGKHLKMLTDSRAMEIWTNRAVDRDRFAHELPAPVNKTSRMASLMR